MASSAQAQNEISALIDARKLSIFQIWVIIACGLVILLDGYDIQTMSLVVPTLIKELGVERSAFSLALSASLIGMLAGYALVGPLGDKFGRRPLLISGMLVVGLGSIATAYAIELAPGFQPLITVAEPLLKFMNITTNPNLFSFVILRFITGVGLGASLPNGTALTSEYVPAKNRAFLIGMMYLNVALGALIAGFAAPPILAQLGWHWIFLVGGFAPLVICFILLLSIPESIALLLNKSPGDPRIPRLLARLAPGVDPSTVYAEKHENVKSQSVFALLSREYWARTLLLWCVFIFNLFVLYAMISWLPAILHDAGWSPGDASRGSVMIQAGGIVGGLIIARFMDRGYTVPAMIGGYIVTVIAFSLFLVLPNSVLGWDLLLLFIGSGISGAQVSLNSLSVIFYPPIIRATGAGWANTMGRAGAIAAPLVAGMVAAAFHLAPVQQLTFLIPPTLVCVVGMLLLSLVWKPNRA
ncbi:MAG: MFS transporter [Alphaproteobacteria bacterium]